MATWEDVRRLVAALPGTDEPVLGAQVADEGVKHALVGDDPEVFFTIPHLDGHPVVLVRLGRVRPDVLAETVQDAWRTRAPRRLLVADDGRSDGPAPTAG